MTLRGFIQKFKSILMKRLFLARRLDKPLIILKSMSLVDTRVRSYYRRRGLDRSGLRMETRIKGFAFSLFVRSTTRFCIPDDRPVLHNHKSTYLAESPEGTRCSWSSTVADVAADGNSQVSASLSPSAVSLLPVQSSTQTKPQTVSALQLYPAFLRLLCVSQLRLVRAVSLPIPHRAPQAGSS